MLKTYPFQALLALAGLGLVIGLPSLQRQQHTKPLISQARMGTCYADALQTQNESKAHMDAEVPPTVNASETQRITISNPVVSEKSLPNTKMRQTLMQCV